MRSIKNKEYVLSPVECLFLQNIEELDKLDGTSK